MEIATNINYFDNTRTPGVLRPLEESARLVKAGGFNFVDYSAITNCTNDNWEELTLKDLKILEKEGLTVEQTHAPCDNRKYPDQDEFKEMLMRSAKISKTIGAKYIVIHGDRYVPDENGYNVDKGLAFAYDYYAPLIEYAINNNLGVAIENLCESDKSLTINDKNRTRFTSFTEELVSLVEKFKHPLVSICWDTGHGGAGYGYDESNVQMKKVAHLISSTHVHDNIYQIDTHSNMFMGKIKWEEVIKILKDANYKGKFTLEMVYGTLPTELIVDHLKLAYKTAKFAIDNY